MGWINLFTPVAVVIAIWVAYRFGQRSRGRLPSHIRANDTAGLRHIVRYLENISQELRRGLTSHHATVSKVKNQICELTKQEGPGVWRELASEAERVLQPTLQLADQIARAYDEIRRQTGQPAVAEAPRSEQLTLSSRRVMEDILKMLLAMKARYGTRFSVALLGIHDFDRIQREQGRARAEHQLNTFATLLDKTVRETDVVVRFGGVEFLVILPETDLESANGFGQRVQKVFQSDMSCMTSIGITEALDGDTMSEVISRVDTALYSAKTAEGPCVFRHTGRQIELVRATVKNPQLASA